MRASVLAPASSARPHRSAVAEAGFPTRVVPSPRDSTGRPGRTVPSGRPGWLILNHTMRDSRTSGTPAHDARTPGTTHVPHRALRRLAVGAALLVSGSGLSAALVGCDSQIDSVQTEANAGKKRIDTAFDFRTPETTRPTTRPPASAPTRVFSFDVTGDGTLRRLDRRQTPMDHRRSHGRGRRAATRRGRRRPEAEGHVVRLPRQRRRATATPRERRRTPEAEGHELQLLTSNRLPGAGAQRPAPACVDSPSRDPPSTSGSPGTVKAEPQQNDRHEPARIGGAPTRKPGQHNWRRRRASSRGNSIVFDRNGKAEGVPPTEIWDDAAGVCPPSRQTVRARMRVWLTNAPTIARRPIRSSPTVPTLQRLRASHQRGAGRDWPYDAENALLDKDLIMGIYAPGEPGCGRIPRVLIRLCRCQHCGLRQDTW